MNAHSTVLLIGEGPPKVGDTPFGTETDIGRRIAHMAGRPIRSSFYPVNIFSKPPGIPFPRTLGVERAKELLEIHIQEQYQTLGGRDLLLAGRRVSQLVLSAMKALGWARPVALPPLEWINYSFGRVALLPHPSARNRWYKEPGNIEKASAFLAQAAGWADGFPPSETWFADEVGVLIANNQPDLMEILHRGYLPRWVHAVHMAGETTRLIDERHVRWPDVGASQAHG